MCFVVVCSCVCLRFLLLCDLSVCVAHAGSCVCLLLLCVCFRVCLVVCVSFALRVFCLNVCASCGCSRLFVASSFMWLFMSFEKKEKGFMWLFMFVC